MSFCYHRILFIAILTEATAAEKLGTGSFDVRSIDGAAEASMNRIYTMHRLSIVFRRARRKWLLSCPHHL